MNHNSMVIESTISSIIKVVSLSNCPVVTSCNYLVTRTVVKWLA